MDMDASVGHLKETINKTTVPENTMEEQVNGNGPHLDPERTGPKCRKKCLGIIVTNVVAGLQAPRSTAPLLIFID